MKPFVLLATRDDNVLADEEYRAVAHFGGLEEDQLERIRLESGEWP
ncbi:UNVERIFIED_CONTAM: glutamine amidotransferase, partial [Acinetobacter sp. HSTU-ASm16]